MNSYKKSSLPSQIQHEVPVFIGFLILQHAKLSMFELYCNFFDKYCDVTRYEELEKEINSLHLALAEEDLYDCIRPEMREQWEALRNPDCTNCFPADATRNFFDRTCCAEHKKHDKKEPSLFKEEFGCAEMLCFSSKKYCCYDVVSNILKFSSKSLNKRVLEQNGEGPVKIFRRLLEEKVVFTSTNRGFRTENHAFATYERTMKGLFYFCPKRIVEADGIHTDPLHL